MSINLNEAALIGIHADLFQAKTFDIRLTARREQHAITFDRVDPFPFEPAMCSTQRSRSGRSNLSRSAWTGSSDKRV